jgi:hypothetical protein
VLLDLDGVLYVAPTPVDARRSRLYQTFWKKFDDTCWTGLCDGLLGEERYD